MEDHVVRAEAKTFSDSTFQAFQVTFAGKHFAPVEIVALLYFQA